MADHDESLIDKAKDALGMGDDDEHRDERRTDMGRTDDDVSRDRGTGWGDETRTGTAAGGTGYDTGRGTDAGMGRETSRTGTMTGTRGEAASGESPLTDDDDFDTRRRETGV